MGAIAPTAMPPSRPMGILLRICHYANDKKCVDFSLKMQQKCLAEGLHPDLVGSLQCYPKRRD